MEFNIDNTDSKRIYVNEGVRNTSSDNEILPIYINKNKHSNKELVLSILCAVRGMDYTQSVIYKTIVKHHINRCIGYKKLINICSDILHCSNRTVIRNIDYMCLDGILKRSIYDDVVYIKKEYEVDIDKIENTKIVAIEITNNDNTVKL